MISGTYAGTIPHLFLVQSNPDTKVTCITGSDLAYCVGNQKVYIGDVTNGAGGSTWTEIK